MFTFPAYPPKDYVLKRIPKLQTDSDQFGPGSEPRVTQTTLGLFCKPVPYSEGEVPQTIQIPPTSPQILDKWANEAKAWWVEKPGKDDYHLNDIFKKYNVKFENYNPNNRYTEKIFNRSHKYELVYLEERRLEKLRRKCQEEFLRAAQAFKTIRGKEQLRNHSPMMVLDCETHPPFWWKTNEDPHEGVIASPIPTKSALVEERGFSQRWASEPCLSAIVVDDPCRRKYKMQMVGQSFKTEACNFYYKNYPPPKVTFRPRRL
ncbi:hypothetical protein ABEB36_001919 [Hypothenemus hampei]|uniref:Uncharacterized protein n=1 Tax=Hypothenemus hampei TaxID=57062 RepID=A0ABD1FIS5_HYPHA